MEGFNYNKLKTIILTEFCPPALQLLRTEEFYKGLRFYSAKGIVTETHSIINISKDK